MVYLNQELRDLKKREQLCETLHFTAVLTFIQYNSYVMQSFSYFSGMKKMFCTDNVLSDFQ